MSAEYPRLIEVLRRRTGTGRQLTTTDIESATPVTDTVLEAADDTGVPIESHPRRLADAVDGDALDELFTGTPSSRGNRASPSDDPTRMVVFDLWDRTFVVTGAAVEVYER